jgi:hypothetical protein
MLCSQFHLSRQELWGRTVKLLPCRNWHCEHCQPSRLKQLRAIAASGDPTICLTLTVNTATGSNPVDRYKALHRAWKILVKRILREFAKPAGDRWVVTTDDGYHYQQIQDHNYTRSVEPKVITRLHYMAFPEETKAGEPHLHILLRTQYIPQRWISQQMAQIIDSPVVWIEKVKGARAAIAYVTKYVTKAPAQFGRSRRYWYSKFWQVKKREPTGQRAFTRRTAQLIHQPFEELVREIVTRGLCAIPRTRTELALYKWRDVQDKAGTYTKGIVEADLVRAYLWLGRWRQECAI